MVLVISRFRVANSLERELTEAFQQRPHLVESTPGFLGMEVFTSPADPSIYHLVTRWTDRETYRTWHKSPEHHLSHHMLPKGLKLDPAFTQVLELDRLPPMGERGDLEQYLFDSTLLLEAFFRHTSTVLYGAISPDGTFQMYNDALLKLLKTTANELRKKTIWDFLADPDQHRFRHILEIGVPQNCKDMRLNFVNSLDMPYTLDCVIQHIPPLGIVLIGEEPQQFNQTAIEELVKIQNEMSVTIRDDRKTERRLLENNDYLDHLVKERTNELSQRQNQVKEMLVELTQTEQRERQELAFDLHDNLAQLLAACRLNLAQIEKNSASPVFSRLVQETDAILDQAMTYTRNLISGLNPQHIQRHGLLGALNWLMDDMGRFGLTVSRPEVISHVTVSEEIATLVYRVLRELLFNILKHAGVSEAHVHWECPSEQHLLIRVTDFGKGFDPIAEKNEQKPGHLGIFYYQERLEAMKAQLYFGPSQKGETTVTITVPVSSPKSYDCR